MAQTKYTYSIASDITAAACDGSSLGSEIQSSAIITALDYVSTDGDVLDIYMKDALSTDDQTILDAVVLAHSGVAAVVPQEVNVNNDITIGSTVAIKEENTTTGGHYQAQSFEVTVPASTGWVTKDITFPIPISLLSAEWTSSSDYSGDEAEFIIAPDTTTGTTSAVISENDTEISVSSTVIDNAAVGYYINIDDNDFGRITAIGSDTITLETPAPSGTIPSSTAVKQTVKLAPHIYFGDSNCTVALGESKIGGSYVPANTTIRIKYNNIDGLAKTFSVILEYLY